MTKPIILRQAPMEIKKIAIDYDEFMSRRPSAWSQICANVQLRFFLFDKWAIHTTECLIAGQNPWLNIVLAWKMSRQHKQITVFNIDGLDAWNYPLLETDEFLASVSIFFPGHPAESIKGLSVSLMREATLKSKIVNLNAGGMRAKQLWSAGGKLGVKLFGGKIDDAGLGHHQAASKQTKESLQSIQCGDSEQKVDWPNGYARMVLCEQMLLTSPLGGYSTKQVSGVGKPLEPLFDNIRLFGSAQNSDQNATSSCKNLFLDTQRICLL